jgi:hypothetical protein
LEGEVDDAVPPRIVVLLAGMGVVLQLLLRLEGLHDRPLLRRLLLRVWLVVGPVDVVMVVVLIIIVLRFCRLFHLPGRQFRVRHVLPKLLLQLLPPRPILELPQPLHAPPLVQLLCMLSLLQILCMSPPLQLLHTLPLAHPLPTVEACLFHRGASNASLAVACAATSHSSLYASSGSTLNSTGGGGGDGGGSVVVAWIIIAKVVCRRRVMFCCGERDVGGCGDVH